MCCAFYRGLGSVMYANASWNLQPNWALLPPPRAHSMQRPPTPVRLSPTATSSAPPQARRPDHKLRPAAPPTATTGPLASRPGQGPAGSSNIVLLTTLLVLLSVAHRSHHLSPLRHLAAPTRRRPELELWHNNNSSYITSRRQRRLCLNSPRPVLGSRKLSRRPHRADLCRSPLRRFPLRRSSATRLAARAISGPAIASVSRRPCRRTTRRPTDGIGSIQTRTATTRSAPTRLSVRTFRSRGLHRSRRRPLGARVPTRATSTCRRRCRNAIASGTRSGSFALAPALSISVAASTTCSPRRVP